MCNFEVRCCSNSEILFFCSKVVGFPRRLTGLVYSIAITGVKILTLDWRNGFREGCCAWPCAFPPESVSKLCSLGDFIKGEE